MFENGARGRVENAGEEPIVDVSIRVEFIDERGEPFCEKIVDIGDIQPGQEVPFVATCVSHLIEAGAWTYEILLGEAGLINSTISQNR